jgi:hypothetical protein
MSDSREPSDDLLSEIFAQGYDSTPGKLETVEEENAADAAGNRALYEAGWDAALASQPEATRDVLAPHIAEGLGGDVYDCGRVWEAWSYGTMSADDFGVAAENPDVLDNIALVLLRDFIITPRPKTPGATQ